MMRGINHMEDFSWAAVARFGGGGGNTTTVQKSDPWIGQQAYLTNIFGRAADLYNAPTPPASGFTQGPQYFPDNTYQSMVPTQTAAQTALYNTGMAGGTPALQSAQNASTALTDPSYTTQTQGTFNAANPAINALSSGALLAGTNPLFNQSQGYLSNVMGGGIGGNAATAYPFLQNQNMLSNTLSGAYLNPASNPGFQNVVNTTLANTMPAITSGFAGAGRSDSGLASRAAAQGATDAIGNLTLQNYLAERQNQTAAGQQAANTQLAQQGLQSQAAQQAASNQATSLGATETAQNLASNNLLTQQGNQIKGVALAPTLDQTTMSNLNTALQAGGLTQQDMQNQINADIQRWNYQQMLPWNNLGLLNSMIQGNYGGTGTSTQPYYTNPTANAISTVGAGLGAAASIATLIAAL